MKWEQTEAGRYSPPSWRLKLGRITVATVSYNGFSSKHDSKKEMLKINLPCINSKFIEQFFVTEKEAKAEAERLVNVWLDAAGLTESPETVDDKQDNG